MLTNEEIKRENERDADHGVPAAIKCPRCHTQIDYTDDAKCSECGAHLCECAGVMHDSDCLVLPLVLAARENMLAALESE